MARKIKIMGILNVTPDSFYDAGRYYDRGRAVRRAFEIAGEGADIIDIGGESTRPGSKPVDAGEEIDRVCPVIEAIKKDLQVPISIDTNKSSVAESALRAGASIVNDISGLSFDVGMARVIAKYNAGVVLMHIKGRPENMQHKPEYDDLISDICSFLAGARGMAIKNGIDESKIIIDPGIGFGKTIEDNYTILNNIGRLKEVHPRVMIGLSRKSLIAGLYADGADRLPATIALNAVSIIMGADIIRVHDVKEHRLALTALEKLFGAS